MSRRRRPAPVTYRPGRPRWGGATDASSTVLRAAGRSADHGWRGRHGRARHERGDARWERSAGRGPLRHVQRLAQSERRRPARHRPVDPGERPGGNGRRDHPAGTTGGPDDAFGFGFFPGQFGMAVYSMHPIVLDDVRTFQTFRWADMPGALLPDDPSTPAPADWFTPEELAQVRLSSKSHWDLPIDVDGRIVHFLVSHPTPPVFDGPEDRNGRRNHDEIRLWADYVTPGQASRYIYDDEGRRGGLPA